MGCPTACSEETCRFLYRKRTARRCLFSAMPGGSLSVCRGMSAMRALRFHAVVLVGDGQLLAAFGAAGCQYAATVSGGHSFTETVLVSSLSVRGLECSFHRCIFFMLLFFQFRAAKVGSFCEITKWITHFLSNLLRFLLICINFAAEKLDKPDNTNIIK